MTHPYIDTLDHFATRLVEKNPQYSKKAIIDLFFISFLENHSNIFKDVDSVAHTDHEIIFFASLIDDIIKYDGPFSLLLEPIKKQTTNRKNIILTLLSKFFFFKNKRKKQPLTKKHIHIDGHLKTQKSDLFPLTRSCLLYHIYLSVASKPSNASKCLCV